MINQPLQSITVEHLQSLIDNQVIEGKTIEYKLDTPPQTKAGDEKREFLADISSFANTDGGDLILGIKSKDGLPIEISGIELENVDDAKLRILNLVRDGIAPRLDLDIHHLPLASKKTILVIRIKPSFEQPHCVTLGGLHRFYRRNSAGKYLMDVNEIKSAFLKANEITVQIRRFVNDRIAAIKTGQTPTKLTNNERWISIHLIPLTAFTQPTNLTPSQLLALKEGKVNLFRPFRARGYSHRINLDGVVAYTGEDGGSYSYLQFYRSGIVESVNTSILDAGFTNKCIPTTALDGSSIEYISKYLKLLQEFNFQCPVFAFIHIHGTEGYTLAAPSRFMWLDKHPIVENDIPLPEVVFQDFTQDVSTTIKPLLDIIWNAGGVSKSLNFDESGKFVE